MDFKPDGKRYATGKRHVVTLGPAKGAVIVYGHGADLGDFGIFAERMKTELSKTYGKNINLCHCIDKFKFMEFFASTDFGFTVSEVHIFCHAFGAGLALGYHVQAFDSARQQTFNQLQKMDPDKRFGFLLKNETGILFTDDLLTPGFISKRPDIGKKFSPNATMKIWGCNSGVTDWIYSDNPGYLYWGILNSENVPKPSIAKAMAEFFNLKTYGAKSGSHVEVLENGAWVNTDEYKRKHGKYPSGSVPHRLEPDLGGYYSFHP
jgi:hypothetical protein